jgi:hypothetical protein
MPAFRAGRRPPARGSSSRNMHRIDVEDALTGVTVRSVFVVGSPRQFGSGASNDETSDVIEQLRETRLGGAEYDIEKTTATPSRLTCRWEQDARGKLACFWTLQPKEVATMRY